MTSLAVSWCNLTWTLLNHLQLRCPPRLLHILPVKDRACLKQRDLHHTCLATHLHLNMHPLVLLRLNMSPRPHRDLSHNTTTTTVDQPPWQYHPALPASPQPPPFLRLPQGMPEIGLRPAIRVTRNSVCRLSGIGHQIIARHLVQLSHCG